MNKILTRLLRPKEWIVKLLLAIVVVAFLAAAFLGYLNPIITFLDSDTLAFQVGETRISAYLVVKALLAITLLFWVAGLFSDLSEKKIKTLRNIKASNRSLITKALQIFIYFIAALIALDVLGIDLTALTVLGGAIGIGIGFGLQKITSNFISGLILLFEKSIEEDDLVELEDGTAGFVRHTGARYTLIETFEGRELMIPNEDFITKRVTNWTFSNTKGRIDIDVGVSYGSDLEKASELILEAANEHPRCSKDTAAECFLVEFGDSSVNFTLFFWVDDIIEGRKRPRSDVLFSIWRKFKENNIEIPFPQRDLHIKNPEALK
ncbi:MAG TPA: mechanosensitive ion channel protein MscS [Gammaproteobacteria bacterium]|jgi:small-conductance mechanosensitive channel|nr:mechanosensitive ion channel protein MscS [Gammaproteobacteria bacterium]